MTNTERIQSNNEELRELIEIADNLPDAGGGGGEPAEPNLQEKSVTPTKSAQEVTADDGYDGLSKVSVGAIPATYQDITGTTAESNHVLEGKFFVNNDGVITEGTMPDCGGEKVTLDVTNQGYDIPEGYHDGGGEVYINLETKSVTPTKSAQTITPSSYRVLSKVNVGAIPDEYIVPTGTKQITANGTHDATEYAAVEVNVPSREPFTIPLGVTANGTYEPPDGVDGYNKVTVNVPIPDGYIKPAGSVEITENGEYDVTEAEKVIVAVEQSGGGDVETTNSQWFADYIMDIISPLEIYNDKAVGTLGAYAFYENSAVTKIELPNIQYLKERCFNGCENLKTLLLPSLVGYTYQYMASGCTSLVNVDVHDASYISSYSFQSCTSLKKLDLHRVGTIGTNAFVGATKFETLIIRTDEVPTLGGTNAFSNTKIKSGGTGYIYVKSALIEDFKASTNWSSFSSQFRAIEDYPDITGG